MLILKIESLEAKIKEARDLIKGLRYDYVDMPAELQDIDKTLKRLEVI